MSPEAACWSKLRQRSTLLPNEHCLLDLHERLTALEQSGVTVVATAAMPAATEVAAVADALVEVAPALSPEPQRPPDVAPIPVSERLPELHELDRQGRCWAYRNTTHEPLGKAWILGTPVSLQLTRPWCSFTHWLPYWSLPIVEDEESVA
jgi:hypothetical protein